MPTQLTNTLEYFSDYKLGGPTTHRNKHVRLLPGNVPQLRERLRFFDNDNLCWKIARRLEDRETSSSAEGVWPINHWRAQRRYGLPGSDAFPPETPLEAATPSIFKRAREMRLLSYFRVRTAQDAIDVLRSGNCVRLSINITDAWYDPPDGRIPYEHHTTWLGAHNIPLVNYVDQEQRFEFPNSWGEEWGHQGWGALPLQCFTEHSNEAWVVAPSGLFPPLAQPKGIVCREWKWALSSNNSVHCRELIDGDSDERLAWAMCVIRHGFLEIDDLYVWPSERGKGYGRALTNMVKRLQAQTGLPLRMLVPYADISNANQDGVRAVATMLGLELVESDAWDVPMIGEAHPAIKKRTRDWPERPAFLLELLRPKDEAPAACPRYKVVFGTDRRLQDEDNPSAGFINARAGTLRTGSATTTVGTVPAFGCFGRIWRTAINNIYGLQQPLVIVNAPAPCLEADVPPALPDAPRSFNLLFVHGFNVTFTDAIEQGARLGAELNVPGRTFVYSWPASAHYLADTESVEAALPHFTEFIRLIGDSMSSGLLCIIAHSMGNRLLLRYLTHQAAANTGASATINHVVFAAPDVDHDVFLHTMRLLEHAPYRKTLYTARGDVALQASELLHKGSRAGLAPPVLTASQLDTILVEGGPLMNLGHAYYGEQSEILHDLFQLFHYSAEPMRRRAPKLTTTVDGRAYWKIEF